ncbi:MAG: site-2 protease family protein [Oscillospiraceae bacterium]
MLLNILGNNALSVSEKLIYLLVMAFCVLLSLSVHELAHGIVAYWQGDSTAKYSGRLTLNPLSHLDPIGGICLFVFGFGWAKPVPVNPYNFKNHKRGMVLTSLGGPASNFIMAFIAQFGVLALGSIHFGSDASMTYRICELLYMLFSVLVSINLGLGLFNLIPIPPLDGSKVLNAVLPARIYFKIMEYERFGFIVLLLIINLPFFNRALFGLENIIINLYTNILSLLPFIG